MPNHTERFLAALQTTAKHMHYSSIDLLAEKLAEIRTRKGRVFVLGAGGSAANASHAVNDFRKLCHIESYSPADNAAELTARVNDDPYNGWTSAYANWLKTSQICNRDGVLFMSVGGGDQAKMVSVNLINALHIAKDRKAATFSIVGRAESHLAQHCDMSVVVPVGEPAWLTPITEAMHGVILHCLVSHPLLQKAKTKW